MASNSSPFRYEIIKKIGQGSYGEVHQAKDRNTKRLVALKKICMRSEPGGFPLMAFREIKIVHLLNHKNIVKLMDFVRNDPARNGSDFRRESPTTCTLVFEFCEYDLAGLIKNIKFELAGIKHVMQQLLNALYYIHASKILHRDIKPANILVTKYGVLKLADFGLSRPISTETDEYISWPNFVGALWYRSPELLLGEQNHKPSLDMWAAGCVMAEMFMRNPFMRGGTVQHQLILITNMCGSITSEVLPQLEKFPLYKNLDLPKGQKRKLCDRLRVLIPDQYALDILDKLLCLDPESRIDADTALFHDFFYQDPEPIDLSVTVRQYKKSMHSTAV